MTTQTILVLVGIVSVFAVFAVALGWADFYSSRPSKTGAQSTPAAGSENQTPDYERRAA